MRRLSLWLSLVAFLPFSVNAAEPVSSKIPMVAVMPFTGRTLDADALETVASVLGSELLNTGKFRVMERSQMDAILKQQDFQQSGACDGSECAVEIGKLLAVDHMVVGTVGKVGGTYAVTTRLVSVQTGEVLKSVTKTSKAEVDAILTDILPQIAQELSGHESNSVPAITHSTAKSPATANEFTDSRDGQTYKSVTIGNQTWMAQNLNYAMENSWCYDNKESNCAKYGRLYNWRQAKVACPEGWHLPSENEWNVLFKYIGGLEHAGTFLKSTNDWKPAQWESATDNSAADGTNIYGFNALPAGCIHCSDPPYPDDYYLGNNTEFWAASSEDTISVAWMIFNFGVPTVLPEAEDTSNSDIFMTGFSLRCLQN